MDEEKKETVFVIDSENTIDKLKLAVAVNAFEEAFVQRSVFGRNPERGKMIKCPLCNLRHRETECHMKEQKFADAPGTPEGQSNPMIATGPKMRRSPNPYWRPKLGVMNYLPTLKKHVKIVE